MLARIAAVLGKTADAARYAQWFERIRKAFQHRFVTAGGWVGNHTQTGYVLALHFDLLPERLRPAALDHLVADIEARGDRLSTGFVGSSVSALGALRSWPAGCGVSPPEPEAMAILALRRDAGRDHDLGALGRMDP